MACSSWEPTGGRHAASILRATTPYQCVTYGGSLLANFSFATRGEHAKKAEIEDDFIQAFKINPNFVVLMDSDKKDEADELKSRVLRVASEASTTHGLIWITEGKEVENYIPVAALRAFLAVPKLPAPGKRSNIFSLIASNGGGKFAERKADLARLMAKHLSRPVLEDHLDLAKRLDEVCEKIRAWNTERPSLVLNG